ncbi:MAG: ankyrin repeat domain-containing protein [Vulcanimicrobiota bacterium]
MDLLETIKSDDAVGIRQALKAGPLPLVNGVDALTQAVFFGSKDVFEVLLEAGHDHEVRDLLGKSLLHKSRKAALTRRLLELGADPSVTDNAGRTPLHDADEPSVVKALLGAGGSADPIDQHGSTPLLAASRLGRFKLVQALLEGGADPNYTDPQGRVPLSELLYGTEVPDDSKEKIAKLLLDAGADTKNSRVQACLEQGWGSLAIRQAMS